MTESTDDGLFAPLIGHDGAKAILRAALAQGDVHVLLAGPPASGKSVALTCIEEAVSGALYRDAAGWSERKLRDTLAGDPPLLLLDEFDEMARDAYPALTTALEQGRVTKAVHGDEYDVAIDTQVVAACNDPDTIPGHTADRFRTVPFEAYDFDEFVAVCEQLLVDSIDWIDETAVARAVAERVHEATGSTSARDARDAARLAGALDAVGDIARAMADADADVASEPISAEDVAVSQPADETEGVAFGEWVVNACPHLPADRSNEHFLAGEFLCRTCQSAYDAPADTPWTELDS